MHNPRPLFLRAMLAILITHFAVPMTTPQDVVKISPETHKVLLENDQVRVLEVRLKPGESVAMHSHPNNVIYYLSDGKLKITHRDGKSEEREVKAGVSVWSEASAHAAKNVGATEFRELQIELKDPAKKLGGVGPAEANN